jgi:hypothetical protein
VGQRQADANERTAARRVLDLDAAALGEGDLPHIGEAKAGPLRPRRVEGLEEVGARIW